MEKVRITEFADPVCTWCWGSSPVTRAIEYRYNGMVEMEYSMSVLIDNIRTFNNRRLQIGGEEIEIKNRRIIEHWLEASTTHGMPVEKNHFHLFSDEHLSTVPQCRAYITARMYDTKSNGNKIEHNRAKRYLRRIQECTACEAMQTCDYDILSDIAATEGYEPAKFKVMMRSGDVTRQFEKERLTALRYGVDTTPTYIIRYKDKEEIIRGYTPYIEMEKLITRITNGKIAPDTDSASNKGKHLAATCKNIHNFISHYKSTYPAEIAAAFGLIRKEGHSALNIESYESLPDLLEKLIKEKSITITPKANSFMIYSTENELNETQKKERHYAGYF